MRVIRSSDGRPMPWKNGGGVTTEIVVSPEGASLEGFDWRVSTAHVGRDGPFSTFAGVDRTLSVLGGNGIRLLFGDGEAVALTSSSDPFTFAADRPVDAVLLDAPIDDLNVMTRRGVWFHTVERLSGPGERRSAVQDGLLVLIAHGGACSVTSEAGTARLAAGDSAVLDGPTSAAVTVERAAIVHVVRLEPSRSPRSAGGRIALPPSQE
ncbi:HutD/Ves family protein [Alsobacter sp. R-9]